MQVEQGFGATRHLAAIELAAATVAAGWRFRHGIHALRPAELRRRAAACAMAVVVTRAAIVVSALGIQAAAVGRAAR